ncbi:Outer-membrane lipoprotein LolB precursor [Microbulbifer aggregans]|uniref:Outer-membrane lipoprotein LolB n=1 Tax=Microbulbifer aggregans TaxID=1769779 RepID=A0A1C9W2Y9_9GAMM|nr:lipoprotein insertase outer membrane protein LolB [Microbulbifer aggregans]AOS95515.1 Outer-membrane lipoprotein LolB precursor [Microbulbifer aggregans]
MYPITEYLPRATLYQVQPGRSALRLLGLLMLALLTACASQTQQKPPVAPELPVMQLQQWTIKGKLGVRSPNDNGSANLTWLQQSQPNYRIHLSGPLGAGATVINGTPAGVSLKRGDEPTTHAANPSQLTALALGWPLPVDEMFYWVRGLPAPGNAAGERRDAQGLLQSLQQAGWQLNFSGYQNVGAYVLPTRIKAETRQAAGPVKVTLVIKEWLL